MRSATVEEGMKRIKEAMTQQEVWNEEYRPRIVPIPGDLAKKRFGLTMEDFAVLAGT